MWLRVLLLCVVTLTWTVKCDQWPFADGDEYTLAVINITYLFNGGQEPFQQHISDSAEMGKFGTGRVGSTAGLLVHVRSANSSSHHGCELTYDNELPVRDLPLIPVSFARVMSLFS